MYQKVWDIFCNLDSGNGWATVVALNNLSCFHQYLWILLWMKIFCHIWNYRLDQLHHWVFFQSFLYYYHLVQVPILVVLMKLQALRILGTILVVQVWYLLDNDLRLLGVNKNVLSLLDQGFMYQVGHLSKQFL